MDNPQKQVFEHQCLAGVTFRDVSLEAATFDDINLEQATFHNVNLSGATFTDINFSHATIDEACIEGLIIWGVEVKPLLEAEIKRRQETAGSSAR